MDIYVDVLNKIAVTGAMDATPAVRPDIRSPTTYTVNLYFLREPTGLAVSPIPGIRLP